ncbi:DUF4258 domain-containing protein [Candidatus Promineifilum breve]|uniref:DUF4258 domain-containing protein n=1 Tax=Candidatus Promineifilum breve TaxID=1806508 RepID=UPI000BA27116|nr:DUF4258 domain-containing protein [Candidatus Promineifilum breve]
MARIDDIRSKVIRDEFEFTRHALDRTILRRIHVSEIREAIDTGQIIEDYPEDKYGPSCLILGFTQAGRPLHLQLTYPLQSLIKLITVYEPDPDEWVDFRIRR